MQAWLSSGGIMLHSHSIWRQQVAWGVNSIKPFMLRVQYANTATQQIEHVQLSMHAVVAY